MFTTELQSEQVQTHPQKFALTLALKWNSKDLIARAMLFDISAAYQNQAFSVRIFSIWPAKKCILQSSLLFGGAYFMLSSSTLFMMVNQLVLRFDLFCDILWNTRTATWKLSVLYK